MSELLFESSGITITAISAEDLYNYLYWDHRIYDLRSKEDFIAGHICRAHHIDPSSIITADTIALLDAQIDDEYGRAEQPSRVIIYTDNENHRDYQLQVKIFNSVVSYLTSPANPSYTSLKNIHILTDGYNHFHSTFSFLCSNNIHYNECSQLVWPSYIVSKLYLGSALCRNETVLTMLGITHVVSFSDYSEKKLESAHVKTLHWQISDSLSATLLPVFPTVVAWISKAIENDKGTVLVHCEQGVSRSASVIIAYLLSSNAEFTNVDVTLDYVRSKRSVIRPNTSFLQQLKEYWTSISTKDESLTSQ